MPDIVTMIAIAAAAAAVSGNGNPAQPVRLEVESKPDASIVRVIARGSATCTATYELAVTASGGGNRSVNRGTVKLPSRGEVTVATVKVGRNPGSATKATLDVTPCGGTPYQQVWTSAEGSARG